jgi:hypothetical protein
LNPNGEDVHVLVLCPIRRCPNDHVDARARSLEHVHRLVGSYQIYPKGKLYQGKITKFDLYGEPTTIRIFSSPALPLGFVIAGALAVVFYVVPQPYKNIISYPLSIVAAVLLLVCLTILVGGLIIGIYNLILKQMILTRDIIQGKKKIKWW